MKRLWILLTDAFWLVVAAGLIAGGFLGYQYLEANRAVVTPQPAERPIALVAAEPLEPFADPVPIRAEGFVRAFREVALSAQVAGRIEGLHPAIEQRGDFAEGEVLVRLDRRTAEAGLAQTDANIASTQARLELTQTRLERGEQLIDRGVIAQETLDQLLSQEAELIATLESLKAARRSAEIALEQTEIRAPFDGAVLSKSAELGTVVSPGQEIARIYTADTLEVTVPVRQSDAALIPGLFDGRPVEATVLSDFANRTYAWHAEIDRVDNGLDARTRTLNVTLRLKDRTAAEAIGPEAAVVSGNPPALINAFAKVVIEGLQAPDLYAVPSTAFREGGIVWLYSDGILSHHPADRVHVDGEQSFVRLVGLPAGAALITSALDTSVDGMAVRLVDDDRRSAAVQE